MTSISSSGHHYSFASALLAFALLAAFVPATALLAQQNHSEKYVLGWTSTDSIYDAMPTVKPDEDNYLPDDEAMAALKQWRTPTEILVFFGSWCKDTRRELPRFLAVLHRADNQAFRVRYLGLDRTKNDSAGVAVGYHITNVPTFVFLRDDEELGRIVEQPTSTIEEEWVDILHNDAWWSLRKELLRMLREALLATALRSTTIF